MNREQIEKAANEFEYVDAVYAGRRCALDWAPWMHDWFTSSSPRNGNSHAEGPWEHWVDLAIGILQDPMTTHVRPGAHEAVRGLPRGDTDTRLSEDHLAERFATD